MTVKNRFTIGLFLLMVLAIGAFSVTKSTPEEQQSAMPFSNIEKIAKSEVENAAALKLSFRIPETYKSTPGVISVYAIPNGDMETGGVLVNRIFLYNPANADGIRKSTLTISPELKLFFSEHEDANLALRLENDTSVLDAESSGEIKLLDATLVPKL